MNSIDDIFLTCGHFLIYYGPVKKIVEYFENSVNFHFPNNYCRNPIFILDEIAQIATQLQFDSLENSSSHMEIKNIKNILNDNNQKQIEHCISIEDNSSLYFTNKSSVEVCSGFDDGSPKSLSESASTAAAAAAETNSNMNSGSPLSPPLSSPLLSSSPLSSVDVMEQLEQIFMNSLEGCSIKSELKKLIILSTLTGTSKNKEDFKTAKLFNLSFKDEKEFDCQGIIKNSKRFFISTSILTHVRN